MRQDATGDTFSRQTSLAILMIDGSRYSGISAIAAASSRLQNTEESISSTDRAISTFLLWSPSAQG
jgi:hypothetical protein